MAHALRGLVQQHQLGVECQRGGNLQRALAAVRQLHRLGLREAAQVDLLQQRHGFVVECVQAGLGLPEMEAGAQLALQADAHVLQHGEVREHGRDLERSHHAGARHLGCLVAGDVLALVEDLARGHGQELGEQVEHGRLAGPVGADQRVDGASPDLEIDLVDRDKSLEIAGEILRLENVFVAHECRSPSRTPQAFRPAGLLEIRAPVSCVVVCFAPTTWLFAMA